MLGGGDTTCIRARFRTLLAWLAAVHRLGCSRDRLLVNGDFPNGLVRWGRDLKLVTTSEATTTAGVLATSTCHGVGNFAVAAWRSVSAGFDSRPVACGREELVASRQRRLMSRCFARAVQTWIFSCFTSGFNDARRANVQSSRLNARDLRQYPTRLSAPWGYTQDIVARS